jgi:anti-sigma factor RsiW
VTHEDAKRLLDAYADGELELVSSLAVEQHLGICDDCARVLTNLRTVHAALNEAAPYYEAPATLEGRIRAAIRDSNRMETRRGFAVRNYSWASAAIAAVLLITIVIVSVHSLVPRAVDLTAREVVDDHLRPLAANHLTDVLSSNQHTVKPWFDGRLHFTPPVIDLTAQGFPLLGGRLDYLDDLPVAAVVYRRREHVINLFVAPAKNAANTQPLSQVRDGYNIVHWTKAGMSYWAVSSVSGIELKKFAQLISEESPPVPTPTG